VVEDLCGVSPITHDLKPTGIAGFGVSGLFGTSGSPSVFHSRV